MKEQFVKWMPVLALACFAAAVFLIADGHFWNGIVFIGAGASTYVRQEKIRKYADLFELTQDLGQPISAYSHGMKQKLAVVSAWLHDPKLIVMDEPFVGLDPKASHLLKEMMREHYDKGGHGFCDAPGLCTVLGSMRYVCRCPDAASELD